MTKRYITEAEKNFLDSNKININESSKEFISTSPMLFTNRVMVQTLISRYELYKKIIEIPGDIIECGVYQGNSFLWLAHLSIIFEPYSINRKLIGFDTFNGFESINYKKDPNNIDNHNFSDTSISTIQAALNNLDLLRPVNKIERFKLVEGDIVNTIPKYIEDNPHFNCALLILDTDLYEPTKVALKYILPNMPKGGIVAFDEFNYQNFLGETLAFKETLVIGKIKLKKFSYDSCLAYFKIC